MTASAGANRGDEEAFNVSVGHKPALGHLVVVGWWKRRLQDDLQRTCLGQLEVIAGWLRGDSC
jgi:hypothetical protein